MSKVTLPVITCCRKYLVGDDIEQCDSRWGPGPATSTSLGKY